jgi:hypothetical protein
LVKKEGFWESYSCFSRYLCHRFLFQMRHDFWTLSFLHSPRIFRASQPFDIPSFSPSLPSSLPTAVKDCIPKSNLSLLTSFVAHFGLTVKSHPSTSVIIVLKECFPHEEWPSWNFSYLKRTLKGLKCKCRAGG